MVHTSEKMNGKTKFLQYTSFAKLKIRIKTLSPLLIKSGESGLTPSNKDMRFLRDPSGQVFIPGSTLKGFFRGNLERMENYLRKELIEYFFGSSDNRNPFASSLYFNASYPRIETLAFESRSQTAIDRETMGVKRGALMFIECLSKGAVFDGSITIRNFDIAQLGLLQAIIQFTNDKYLRIGFNKTRGYGAIQILIKEITIDCFSDHLFSLQIENNHLIFIDKNNKRNIDLGNFPAKYYQREDTILGKQIVLKGKCARRLMKKSLKQIINKKKLKE